MPIDRNLLLVAEHWMMYAEARTFNDAASAAAVLVAATRTDARRVESRVTGSSLWTLWTGWSGFLRDVAAPAR